jgi:hypothetical protein
MTIGNFDNREWRTRLIALEAEHARDGSRLEISESLWSTLDGGVGNNLKSVPRAVKTFRGIALRSPAGLERLASSLKEVFEISGQLVVRSDLDDELYWAMSRTHRDADSESVRWLRATVGSE